MLVSARMQEILMDLNKFLTGRLLNFAGNRNIATRSDILNINKCFAKMPKSLNSLSSLGNSHRQCLSSAGYRKKP